MLHRQRVGLRRHRTARERLRRRLQQGHRWLRLLLRLMVVVVLLRLLLLLLLWMVVLCAVVHEGRLLMQMLRYRLLRLQRLL